MRIPVPGYEGYYEIDTKGNVWNIKRGIALKTSTNNRGYRLIHLQKQGKKWSGLHHRLVAECFIANPDGLEQVNHINGDKTDNRPSNLEWVSRQQNWDHAKREQLPNKNRKLSLGQIDMARDLHSVGMTQTLIAKLMGVAQPSIHRIINA